MIYSSGTSERPKGVVDAHRVALGREPTQTDWQAIRPGSVGKPERGRRIAVLPLDGGTDPLPPGQTRLRAIHRDCPGLMLGY